jgi:hypothetical protein
MAGFLGVQHHWDQALTMYQTAWAAARQAGDRPGQGRALNMLASAQIEASDFAAAEATLQQSLALHRPAPARLRLPRLLPGDGDEPHHRPPGLDNGCSARRRGGAHDRRLVNTGHS